MPPSRKQTKVSKVLRLFILRVLAGDYGREDNMRIEDLADNIEVRLCAIDHPDTTTEESENAEEESPTERLSIHGPPTPGCRGIEGSDSDYPDPTEEEAPAAAAPEEAGGLYIGVEPLEDVPGAALDG